MSGRDLSPLVEARRLRLERSLRELRDAAASEARCRDERDRAQRRVAEAERQRADWQRQRAAAMARAATVGNLSIYEARAGWLTERIDDARAALAANERKLAEAAQRRAEAQRDWQLAQRRVDALQQLVARARLEQRRALLRSEERQLEERRLTH